MTLYEFRLLSRNEQVEAVWQGEFFLSRENITHAVLLYKVHNSYVEVYYNIATNEIEKFNPFSFKTDLRYTFTCN